MSAVRIAGVVRESIVDGPGIRFVVFTQGCPHRCPGCHNPHTHDAAGGYDCEVSKLLDRLAEDPLVAGVTLSGGEPFEQPEPLAELAAAVKARGLNLMAYSGYTYEQLLERAQAESAVAALLLQIDYLVDGPFVLAERDLTLAFRGSKNQRIIDLPKTRAQGSVVLAEFSYAL